MNTTQETTARYTVESDGDTHRVIDHHGDDARTDSTHDDVDVAYAVARGLNQAHRQTEDRKGIVAGLRALANFLESTPELQVDWVTAYYSLPSRDAPRERLADLLPHLGDYQVRESAGSQLRFARTFYEAPGTSRFPHVVYEIVADREKVCTPRVEDGAVVWDLPAGLAEAQR